MACASRFSSVLTMIGAALLGVGRFGFNAGVRWRPQAYRRAGPCWSPTPPPRPAGFAWMIVGWLSKGKPTVIGICLGVGIPTPMGGDAVIHSSHRTGWTDICAKLRFKLMISVPRASFDLTSQELS